ncbi:MAG: DMT family transporter, partial [bacterium]
MKVGVVVLPRGAGRALLAAALFGVGTPLVKGLVPHVAPQLLAGLLYLGSGAGLGAWAILRRRSGAEAPLETRDAPWLAGAIAVGGIVGPVLLMMGLRRTPASTASLLLNLEGVFTALVAWYVFAENFDRRVALGIALILGGATLLSWQGGMGAGGLAGPLAVAAACACWAVDNNLTQKVSGG